MIRPGFTLEDYFTKPAIKIPYCQSTPVTYINGVQFKFNSFGYRTIEFDDIPDEYFLVTGCSLTEGHGLDYEETWSYQVSKHLGMPVINLAKGGGNAEFCNQVIQQWIPNKNNPKFIIAQWPNMYRILQWRKNKAEFIFNKHNNLIFVEYLKQCDDNFFAIWLKSIISANEHCDRYGIPILNICFESIDTIPDNVLTILKNNKIELHIDQKLQGKTWLFDNKAKDNLHHSAWCNQKWAERIIGLLN